MPLSIEGENRWEGDKMDNERAPSTLGHREALTQFLTSLMGYKAQYSMWVLNLARQ